MKKYRGLSFLFLIIIITVLIVVIYETVSTGNNKDNKSKALSEVEFLEQKFQVLLNQMNNIETRNYSVSVTEISQETKSENGGTTGKQQDSEGSSQGNSSGGSSGSESGAESENGKQEENDNTGNSQESERSKKFELKPIGVLSNDEEINWDNVKNEVEILYTSIPTITLDLYALNISQDDILGFNKEFDNLTVSVKTQNKQNTLSILAKLYGYIPKFIQNTTADEIKKSIVDTKIEIFNSYSKLDSKNWVDIDKNVKLAIEKFSKLLTKTDIASSTQYKISKIYVMLNELENAVLVQDESVFLIKYKNILEEIDNV